MIGAMRKELNVDMAVIISREFGSRSEESIQYNKENGLRYETRAAYPDPRFLSLLDFANNV